ncbi:CLUMA_CG019004, isoform A [Clunio marinus]|uniref:CLUMA_CG019004, isoform A n=1 Tax=Clunio marinus TaxID=568069 RepID=A0A1J1J105_9DIPT|nr:CLUMA_CG019004, isoform A [Clunio marinus]
MSHALGRTNRQNHNNSTFDSLRNKKNIKNSTRRERTFLLITRIFKSISQPSGKFASPLQTHHVSFFCLFNFVVSSVAILKEKYFHGELRDSVRCTQVAHSHVAGISQDRARALVKA